MKLLMTRKIVPFSQSIYLILGVALGVLALLTINSLFLNYKRGLEITLLGSVPNVKVSLENINAHEQKKLIQEVKSDTQVDSINEVLTIQGKARAYSLKPGDGVFGYKKDVDFVMHGIKIFDIGHYILLVDRDAQSNPPIGNEKNIHDKIREGLIAYREKLVAINQDPILHNKICGEPIEGRQYCIDDIDTLINKPNYEPQDAKLLYSMERCISSSVGTTFALDLENVIFDRNDLNSLAYSDYGVWRVLINDGFSQSILTQPAGKIKFEINAITNQDKIEKIPEKIFLTTGGVFKQGFLGGGSATIFISMDKMAESFGIIPEANEIFIKLNDPYQAQKYAENLKAKWGGKLEVTDWITANKTIFSFILLLKTLLFIVLFMIILVSTFGISAQLFMTVYEKERHVSILKAIGASSSDIVFIFMLYSTIVGIVGTALGISGAFGVSYLTTKLQGEWISDLLNTDKIIINISSFDIVLILSVVTGLCLLAAIIPAKRAAETDPIHGLNL